MIALGSDHAGLPLKKEIIALLEEMHLPYHDYAHIPGIAATTRCSPSGRPRPS